MNLNGEVWEDSGNVPAGASKVLLLPAAGLASITLIPGNGGTALLEASNAPQADIQSGIASWTSWSYGPVNAKTSDDTTGSPRALRVTATGAACRYEFCQRPR